MKTPAPVIAITATLLSLASLLQAAPTAAELMAQASAFDRQLKPASALPLYLQVEVMEPRNAKLLVCIAKQYSYMMTDATSPEEKSRQGENALAYARRAVAADPNLCDAHLALAVCQGKLLPLLETRQKLEGSRVVKASAEKAVALEPGNDLAWHMLGRWHQELANIGGTKLALAQFIYGSLPAASNEESARCLEKALALNPDRLMHQIELGRTYAQMRRNDEARKLITKGLAMPDREKDDPDTKERGRYTLSKLDS